MKSLTTSRCVHAAEEQSPPQYAQQPGYAQPQTAMSDKKRNVYAVLGFFLGFLGVHDFYIGNIGRGVMNIIGNFLVSPFLVQVSTGFELLTTKTDSKKNMLQDDATLSIILGILLIIINLILGIIVFAALIGGVALFS